MGDFFFYLDAIHEILAVQAFLFFPENTAI